MKHIKCIQCFLFVFLIQISCSKEEFYLVKEVVLTFDDAPNFPENTRQILDILSKHQTKATFFCIGQSLRLYPELAVRIASEQFMANHTYTHINLANYNLPEIYEQEIQQTQNLIDSLQPNNHRYFRPPHGNLSSKQKEFLIHKAYDVVMWDLSAEEWNDNVTSQEVINYYHKNLYSKSEIPVILFHLNQSTIEALDILLDEFEEADIDVITLDELKDR
jgi:peptidoglycan-N-acetylglucosamine deacetylase